MSASSEHTISYLKRNRSTHNPYEIYTNVLAGLEIMQQYIYVKNAM